MEHEHAPSVAAAPAFVGNDVFQDILERRLASKLASRPKRAEAVVLEAPAPARAPEPEEPRAEERTAPSEERRSRPQRRVREALWHRAARSRSFHVASVRVAVCAVRDNSVARDRIFLKLLTSK